METKSCQEGSLWQLTTSPLWKTLDRVITNHQRCHARPCAGYPRISLCELDVDGRDKPDHDVEGVVVLGGGLKQAELLAGKDGRGEQVGAKLDRSLSKPRRSAAISNSARSSRHRAPYPPCVRPISRRRSSAARRPHQRQNAVGAVRAVCLQPFGEQVADLKRKLEQHIAAFLTPAAADRSRMRSISMSVRPGITGATMTEVGTPASTSLATVSSRLSGRARARLHGARQLLVERGDGERDLDGTVLGDGPSRSGSRAPAPTS